LWLFYYYCRRCRHSSYITLCIIFKQKCLRILLCGVCAVGYSWYLRTSTRDWHGPRICGIETGIPFVGSTIRDGAFILYYIKLYFIFIIINIDSCTHAALSESLMIFVILQLYTRSRAFDACAAWRTLWLCLCVWVTAVSLNRMRWIFHLDAVAYSIMLIVDTLYNILYYSDIIVIYCSGRPLGPRHTESSMRPLFLWNTEIHYCLFYIYDRTDILRRLIVF